MAKKPISNQGQLDLFDDWLVVEPPPAEKPVIQLKESSELSYSESRHLLALRLAQRLDADGEITSKGLTDEANRAFGGTQAEGKYSSKDAYDALEAAFNIHLLGTEDANWTEQNADAARAKAVDLTNRIQRLPTQTRRDEEMDEFQQFSTPPALSFVANWVANVKREDVMGEPSAGTGDLAIWSKIAGAKLVLNELSPRRQALLGSLFPDATIFKENAEQLDNVLPPDIKPTVIVMNPPFSSTAGRVQGQRDTKNGARHINEALKRLEDGGRLVAIVGNGMAADRPAFNGWWKDIERKYNVRANVGISGKEYAKYGTTFDNQILVIDKTGATTQPVLTGKVESVADLPHLLEGIRNDRQQIQSTSIKPTGNTDTQSKPDSIQSGNGTGGVGIGADGAGTQSIGNGADSRAVATDGQTGDSTSTGNVVNDGIGAGDGVRASSVGNGGRSGGGDTRGNSGITEGDNATPVQLSNDQSKEWDSLDYGGRQNIAQASDLGGLRAVVHRLSGSKWSELSPGEKQSMVKAMQKEKTAPKSNKVDALKKEIDEWVSDYFGTAAYSDDSKADKSFIEKFVDIASSYDDEKGSREKYRKVAQKLLTERKREGEYVYFPNHGKHQVFADKEMSSLVEKLEQEKKPELSQSTVGNNAETGNPLPIHTFTGSDVETYVTPNKDGKRFNVSVRDIGSGEMLSETRIFNTSVDAVKQAKKIANINDTENKKPELSQSTVGNNAEVTSETARKAEFKLTGGGHARILENAERGEFSVSVSGERYGTFLMDDAGKVSGIKTRANWADSYVIEAANTFAAIQRGETTNVADADNATSVTVEAKEDGFTEFTDSVFANYTPQRLSIPGAQQHPGKLVQSAAMSAVEPPAPTYSPVLPANVVNDGLLSIAQLESVVYAGQAHSELLPNGSRKGFFIGDGTGVGKGREISGIILDNMMQGRNKAVWVSFNEGLIEDARRDFAGVGGDPSKIFFQGKTKASGEITQQDGILFTTYSTLRGGEKKQSNDLGQKGGKTRAQQIIDWLGTDFDGVIAFDEAHSMGNAIAIKGNRGVRKPSQQAIAGINLQRDLPDARVTYVSATGATEISNLSYADRLGLWGEGTPFADTNAFISNVSKGGIASMELISRDMKAMGMYLARSLSYDGVSYERLEHTLSDLQEDIYNELAGSWQVVLNNVEQALDITQAGKSGPGKSAAMAQFWGAHQRFFNQIITAMQTPRVIDDIREQLDAGNVAVIQIVNTNEAAQERIIADATANDSALEDLDFTPRQMLMDYVRNGFPVAAYEESQDDNGNTVYQPVRDSEGNQVFDREAIALRDGLLETLQQIRVPENPLDSIINAFGSDRVAEITGRSRRFVQTRDDDGNLKVVEEKRGKNSSRADAEAFQGNKKDILVFSGAGGTGYSFHADNTAENQRKRVHYILQPGWRADSAVQGFGRTHRTNQANEPHYVLPTTNLKAQKRFVSSIARRLDQLGALTRGQREATSQGMFTASDNLESEYATVALNNFFGDLYRGKTDLSFHDVTKQMGLNLLDENASFSAGKVPAIPQFLNRLLSLKTDMQNAVFGEFEKRLVEAVEYAKQRGLYDVGLQTMTAMSIQKTRDTVAYEDKKTGAQTRYVELAVTNEVKYSDWEEAKKLDKKDRKEGDLSGWFVSEFGKNKGDVFYLSDIGERIDGDGKSVRRGVVHTIKTHDHRYIDNADVISRGYDYRSVSGSYQRVDLTRAIDVVEAEKLWREQVATAPKTETKTERMLVGVILPVWDRVEGAETIKRLQTDEGEQLLGRMLGPKSAKQTLKNLGLDSGLSTMTASDLFAAIKKGSKAILSNGWEIATAKVNYEDRIELKGRGYLTDAEKRVLKEQGAFIERISWAERVFIPTGENGLGVFERITSSKPVVDLIGKNDKDRDQDENEAVQESATFNPPSSKLDTVVAASENTHKIEVESLPEGWTESQPGGLIASLDPEKGGIIDSEIVSGKWFVIPNNDSLTRITDLETRSDAIKALETAVSLLQPEQSSKPDQTDQGNAPIPPEPNSFAEPQAPVPAVFNHLDNQEVISMDKTKKPFHETVAEKLIEQLEQGTAPWQKPWNPGEAGSFLPYNPVTGKRYKGVNSLHLMAQERSDSRFMTYNQATKLGGQVRKGEHGTAIEYWKFTEEQTKRDDDGNPVLDNEGKPVKVVVKLERPRLFHAKVFNAEQIDGLPPLEKKEQTWDPIERAEGILTASGADISHNGHGRAFYRPSTDSIHLPDKGQFPTAENYYATALHELGHWTGHKDRLNRDLAHPFGSQSYAKEELRAEIASMILGDELGIGHDPSQHAAYVGSWIKALKDDPMEIFRAAADAEKIQNFVIGLEQNLVQEKAPEQTVDQLRPHEMTLAEFTAQAVVEKLENHGRKWNVKLGDYSAFSDSESSADAVADVHRAAVNNALYLNSPENSGSILSATMPPLAVLMEYPDLAKDYGFQNQIIEFKDVTRGAYSGQVDQTLIAVVGGVQVGILDYSIYNGIPAIQMVEVESDHRRMGYATELVKQLQRQFPNTEIEWGELTADGAQFRDSLRIIEKPSEHAPDYERLNMAIAERDRLLSEADNFNALKNPTPEQIETHSNLTEPLNNLHDLIYDLENELSNQSATVRLIDTENVNISKKSAGIDAEPIIDAANSPPLSTVPPVDIASVLPQSLPRADLSALGPVGQAIAVTRLLSDQVGITADIERLAFNGLTASQIAQDLEDRLTPIADQGLVPFVRQVRASLGIPPLDVVQAFSEWRDTVEARLSSPSVNVDVLPRADVSALGPVGESIDRSRELADRLGLTAEIERLAFDGLTDTQISASLESRLDPIMNLALQEQRDQSTAAVYFVRQVQASLGIPPLDDTDAHQSWRTKVSGRLLLDQSQLESDAAARKVIEANNNANQVIPKDAMDNAIAMESVRDDISEFIKIEDNAERRMAAIAMGHNADGQVAYRSELQRQNPEIAKEVIAEFSRSETLNADIASVLYRSDEWTFDHYQDYEGDSLDAALRKEGLNSIGDVTGNMSGEFFDTAIINLSPVFGIEPTDNNMSNAYLERKGLAQAFQTMAERLVQVHSQQENIRIEGGIMRNPIADNSTDLLLKDMVRNIEYAQDIIPEWRGNYAQEQGNGNVRRAIELIEKGELDKAIDALWLNVELEHRYGGEDSDVFRDSIKMLEESITPAMKRGFDALPRDLGQLSLATFDEYQKAAEAARLEEEAVKNNPDSTEEDISAAREKRKSADLLATVNDSDFQNKVAEFEQKQQATSVAGQGGEGARPEPQRAGDDKTFIAVPFREKEEAKTLGAKWDRQQTSWYIPAGVDQSVFSKWLQPVGEVKVTPVVSSEAVKSTTSEKLYLAVPYSERFAAKEAGAKWDAGAKSWYVGKNANMETLQRWVPDNNKPQQEPAMTPHEEFSSLLKDMGFVLSGNHPVMDGQRHRLETVGDKAGEKAGFYVAHLDGHPAGFAQNNRTGEAQKWKSKGYSLSDGEKAELQAQSASKLQARENELKAKQDAVAASIRQLLAVAPLASADHKYLQSKEARPGDLRVVPNDSTMLPPDSAVMIGKTWKESKELRDSHPDKLVFTAGDLLLAAQDLGGVVRSVQSIQENGMKRFAAGGAKQDMFHVVGGNGVEALARAPAIVIGEGYATADTLSQSLGYPTVAAFDSGNLPHVAKLLHDQFPDKPVIIAGDNDLHQELTEGRNPGKEKAEAAAKAVGGVALFPIFAPGEQVYPADLAPVTPALAKGDGLSGIQKEAISKMKSFTDFNDLATKSELGREGVERQVTNVVNKIVSDHYERIETRQQQDNVLRLEQQQQQKLAAPRKAAAAI